jgi:hypothetical protein
MRNWRWSCAKLGILAVERRAKADAWIAAKLKEATLYAQTHSRPRPTKP